MKLMPAVAPKRTSQPVEDKRLAAWKDLVVGQGDALDRIWPYIDVWEGGLAASERPAGVFMLVGPTGTGKGHAVEKLAEVLHGDSRNYLRVDCGEFQMEHEVAKLIGCFAPEMRVLLADGTKRAISSIRVGDKVITKQGRIESVLDIHTYRHHGDMISVNVVGHPRPLLCTPDHKVWAIRVGHDLGKRLRNPSRFYDESRLEYIKASDLRAKDIVAYPRLKLTRTQERIDLVKYRNAVTRFNHDEDFVWCTGTKKLKRYIEIDERFMRLAGYYVSDGGLLYGEKGINFTFGIPQKEDLVDDVIALAANVFGKENLYVEDRSENGSVRISVSSCLLARLFSELFGNHTKNKHVPEWFLLLSPDLIAAFLDAAIAGDGCVKVKRRIDYSTISPTLASQMEVLFARLGIATQTQECLPAREGWQMRYRLYVSGEQITKAASLLSRVGRKLDLTNTGNGGIQRGFAVTENFTLYQIRSVGSIPYAGPVYDLSVAKDTSYVVEGLGVSNSPPGYLGHRETQPMLSAAKLKAIASDCNLSIVLFDEIEKAAGSMQRILLGILDKGTLRLGDNTTVNFEKTLIFLSSNLGARKLSDAVGEQFGLAGAVGEGTALNTTQALSITTKALRAKFTPEFINRLDEILLFTSLTREDFRYILRARVDDFNAQLEKRLEGVAGPFPPYVTLASDAEEWLLDKGFSKEYGARELKRTLFREVRVKVARALREKPKGLYELRGSVWGGELGFGWVKGGE